jgi:HEAT repeat protein
VRQVMIQIVAWTGGILAGLTLLIAINKARREAREVLDRRRRVVLEPAVLEYVHASGSRSIRDYLPKPLSRRDRRLAEAILLEGARFVKGETRHRITAALETLGAVEKGLRRLGSRRWWTRAEAAERLGLMRSPAAVEPLVRLMNDPDGEVRLRAARALGIIRGGTSVRPLVAALADPSRWSAIRVAEILILAGAEAVDELLAAYESLPLRARISALDILGRSRSLKAAGLLRKSLRDVDPNLRARAAHGLGLIGDPGAVEDLTRALRDPEWPVRAMAAKALGRLGGGVAVAGLCEALKDRSWWVRANAGEALRAQGSSGREALLLMLDAVDVYARHQAVAQLEEGGVLDQFIADLASPDPGRRAPAARVIEKVVRLERVDHLTQEAFNHAQEPVRRALAGFLRRPPPQGPA